MKRKIKCLAVTGIRSEYDILYPVLDSLRGDGEFDLKVVASGAHLSDFHGFTLNRIIQDGFEIADRIDSMVMTDRVTQRAKGTGMLISAMSQTVERESPDFLLVVGDREESIAAALVGNYMDVLVAHIGGGDPVYGNADDPVRMAVSKLAHLHMTTAQRYADNLLSIGEEDFRIFNVGNPAYRNIQSVPELGLDYLSECLDLDIRDGQYVLFIKHPLSSERSDAGRQMDCALEALDIFAADRGVKVIGIYPNTDPGSFEILGAIGRYDGSERVRFFKTLARDIFVNLARHALALAGNSSMGILEAPFYGLPVVNIGHRQRGRLNAGNVDFVDHEKKNIITALERACFDEEYRKYVTGLDNPYGDGSAPEKIRDILKSVDLSDRKWYVKSKLV